MSFYFLSLQIRKNLPLAIIAFFFCSVLYFPASAIFTILHPILKLEDILIEHISCLFMSPLPHSQFTCYSPGNAESVCLKKNFFD